MLRARMDKLFSDALYIRQVGLEQGLFLYVFLKNGLEFDLVLMPTSALQVRSAHWKILTDKTGQVLSRMHSSQLRDWSARPFGTRCSTGSLKSSMRCAASYLKSSAEIFCM